jgi:hypothetical protein
MPSEKEHKPFEIYRKDDYREYGEHGIMQLDDITPEIAEGLTAFNESGASAGQLVRMAYSRPGMSLTHVWFKSGYPLPLHSHTSDCLYYILAGSIRVGAEEMGPGDGFFVGCDVPYTYETGPNGAEVLEFRATDLMNIRFMAKNKTAWDKTVAKIKARREHWETEQPPSLAEI